MHPLHRFRKEFSVLILISLLATMAICLPTTSAAPLSTAEKQALAEQFAPHYYFTSGEKVYPVDIDHYLPLCNLNITYGMGQTLVSSSVTADTLQPYDSDYCLDNRLGTNHDDRIIAYYEENEQSWGYTVYSHVFSYSTYTVIQYWTFYFFNDGPLNQHEGDWEMVQVILDSNLDPQSVAYSQHESGQSTEWSQAETSGDHFNVYVAEGSHANYFRYYQGMAGFANDKCGNNGKQLTIDDYEIQLIEGTEPWLTFQGRWGNNEGNDARIGQAGPFGPMFRQSGEMWAGVPWGDMTPMLSSDQLNLDWLYYHFIIILVVLIMIGLLLVAWRVYRARKAGKLVKPFFGIFDMKGDKGRALANILALIAIVIGVLSLFFPYYTVAVNIDTNSMTTNGWQDVLLVDGMNGVRINTLDPDQGLAQLTAMPVPIGLLIIIPLAFLILGTIGVSDKRIGNRYIGRFVHAIIPVLIIVVFISMLTQYFVYFVDIPGAEDAEEILREVASSPLIGSGEAYMSAVGETADVRWGIGMGSILLIIAGILFLIAGIVRRSGKQEFPGQMNAAVVTDQPK